MKNNHKINSSNTKRTLFSEKTLLVFFAGLSLAFAVYYTFSGIAAQAVSPETAVASDVQNFAATSNSPDTTVSPATAADVVTKALAFKAMLTASQQATLEQTYTTALARKWSNLPCGAGCRNGIQFSTLTADQLTAALAVIQAATGTTANEGFDEFQQIRAADAYLGANGGGSGYSSGIYFISFLNTPSTTGAWMLQFGGHHYAANIAFVNGHYVSATPYFMGVEPTTFTVNGTIYAPLEQERGALQNMLASLTTDQLTTARLTQTFSDVTMSPGETNGGNGTFPTTRVGIPASSLSDAQKLLILEAIKPYVRDVDDTVAANLLTIYQNELNGTYVSYTGSGTTGNPSSFLNTNTNYVRIDGPSVWIEFICQTGVVFRNQIHYHTIWRDRQRDYARDFALTTPLDNTTTTTARTRFDFDGDAKADLSVFRSGAWYRINSSTSAFSATQFGQAGDQIVSADYDGDAKTDIGVFRAGNWYILNSATNTFAATAFGQSGDAPVPGDFDGDNKADIAVFRAGNWYRINSATNTFTAVQFGASGDTPVPVDYDGDGRADIAVWRGSNGTWYRINSQNAAFAATQFGQSGDKPVPADYDGDAKADLAVFRAGNWYKINSSTGAFSATQFGASGDTPVAADYDGDGRVDIAVFRPANGAWYILNSQSGAFSAAQFGQNGDTPIPAAFIP